MNRMRERKDNMKRRWISMALALCMALTLAGCNSSGSSGGPSDSGEQSGENTEPLKLNVVNWKDYGPDSALGGYDFIRDFEERYNCEIVLQYIASQDDQLTKLKTAKAGEIDVCLPNCTILPDAIEAGLLKKLDTSRIPAFSELYGRFQSQEECMRDGEYYAVPFVWGSTALAYNTDDFDTAPTSVGILFDPAYSGQISLRDSYDDAIMTAAIYLGQDPNHPSDLEAIKNVLLEQKPLNCTYWKSGDDFSKLFAGKQISVGLMWAGQSASMKMEGEPIGYVVPQEGAIGWVDNWAIASTCQNEDLAYAFISEMLSADFQYRYASSGGPAPTNRQAAERLDPEYIKAAGMDEDSLNRLYFKIARSNEEKTLWNELWTEIKATAN